MKNTPDFNFIIFLKRNWLFLSFCLLLPIIIYFNSLFGSLISDDIGLLKGVDKFIHFDFEIAGSFLRYLWITPVSLIFGDNPIPYHLGNLVFHLGNVFLVYLIITRLKGKKLALFTSLFFAIHPILSEGVDWISSGGYLQANFFFLLSFYFYIFQKSKRDFFLSLFFFVLMLLSFNRSVLLFALFILYEAALGDIKKNWKKLVPFTLVSLLWLSIFIPLLPDRIKKINGINNQTIDANSYPLVLLYSLSSYLKLFFWPLPLSFFHSQLSVNIFEVTYRILVIIIFSTVTVFFYFRNKFIFFWLAFFPVSLLLFLNPLNINWIVAERYVYLGSLGLIVPIAFALSYFVKRKNWRIPIYTIVVLILILLSWRTFVRNFDWKNQNTLYDAILKIYPNSPGAQTFVSSQGSNADADINDINVLMSDLKSFPNQPQTYYNLGRYYQNQKDYPKAIDYYRQALKKDSNFYLAYQNMANSLYFSGDVDQAIEADEKAVSLHPDPTIYVNLGVFYQKKQDWKNAAAAFGSAMKLDPKTPHAKEGLEQSESLLQGKTPSISK